LDEAIKIVKNHDRLYKEVDYWKKEAAIAKHDLLGQQNNNPKLFVLRGIDGGIHHAILVVGSIIFDSNLGQCLTLSKASLDWCLLLYWSNPVSQVLRAMAFKRTTHGRSNFGELMTVRIS
jgi:hypothetical protein